MNPSRVRTAIFVKFMLLFGINRIEITSNDDNQICAIVGWPLLGRFSVIADEELQEVRWDVDRDQSAADVAFALDFFLLNDFLRGDRIEVPEPRVLAGISDMLQWDDARSRSALEKIMGIRVSMIDEGVASDSFFLHF